MQYILNENHLGYFFILRRHKITYFFSSNNIGLDQVYTIIV